MPLSPEEKAALVSRVLAAKEQTGLTFDQIGDHLGVTNVYASQLFMNQAQLKPATAEKLAAICPGISPEDLIQMQKCPMRSFDPTILQDPLIFRLVEACQHYGQSVKNVVNDLKGDGIISAIDLFVDAKIVKGSHGEDRGKINRSHCFYISCAHSLIEPCTI
jgi:cyanate lyase